jgi:hypothetical protein
MRFQYGSLHHVSTRGQMKFIGLCLILLAGCSSTVPNTSTTTVKVTECPMMARASGTTGTTSYTCERLACDEEAFTFRCEFTNISEEAQPGVSIRIGLYSEATKQEVLRSNTIFANSLQPGQSEVKALRWSKEKVKSICGATLDRCVFLTDHVWPR